jgi:hypothetical protein
MRNVCTILVKIHEGNKPLTCRQEHNNKMHLRAMVCEVMLESEMSGFCKHGDLPSVSIKV